MENNNSDWQFKFDWLQVRHEIKDMFERDTIPDMNAILFLIGIRELGKVQAEWTKEEKQDLMHIAICELLSKDGFYAFEGLDQDGWPHYKQIKKIPVVGAKDQERLLKEHVITYFRLLKEENSLSIDE